MPGAELGVPMNELLAREPKAHNCHRATQQKSGDAVTIMSGSRFWSPAYKCE